MYPGDYAQLNPDRAAIIMADSGTVVTYREFEALSNRLSHYFRSKGLNRLDHYAIFMENNHQYLPCCSAGERSGLYYTCVNSYLTADELAYIINNSQSRILITSESRLETALAALPQCPAIEELLVIGLGNKDAGKPGIIDFDKALSGLSTDPIPDEKLGGSMLYSSGTTGRPKGIIRPLEDVPPADPGPLYAFLLQLWQFREDMIYLSPAPLYHSAPLASASLVLRMGGTIVVMEKFDPLSYLRNVERYKISHSQLVPTMFSRMLKLPETERNRFDLSSLEIAIHAAAPCPVKVKEQMIEWWGPIIHEYYGATEGLGFTACNSEEWLAHRGTVGKVIFGDLHILDDDMRPLPPGKPGTMWFKTATEFSYFDDTEKTAEATSPDGTLTTVGDVGYLDADGFLYLTDRKTFMIISGGVNIYPQECEDLLISHPKVADAAVIGVPNVDLGEEVKAVVQPLEGEVGDEALTAELLEYLGQHLSRQKLPRSIDYEASLPRLPTGKLYKRKLRDRYWGEGKTKIV